MPHRQRHRGRHPTDAALFAPDNLPVLRRAVEELSWLITRGYAETAALKLVGDRHALRERQRRAVARCACSDDARRARARRRADPAQVAGRTVAVDGFNCLITIEAVLAGGIVLLGRDGCLRDLSCVHGSYRRVAETRRAVLRAGEALADLGAREAHWYLDKPISNSGSLAGLLREIAAERGWRWRVELCFSPDREILADPARIAASSDSWILDRAPLWLDLPAATGSLSGVIDLRDA